MENTIYIAKTLLPNMPILIVDLDEENVDDDYKSQAKKIIKNIKKEQSVTSVEIYHTSNTEPIKEMSRLSYKQCLSWYKNSDTWRKQAKKFIPCDEIQICGMFRELCIVSVADLLISAGVKPIIIANDGFSISAKLSVADGETLENRAEEVGRQLKHL